MSHPHPSTPRIAAATTAWIEAMRQATLKKEAFKQAKAASKAAEKECKRSRKASRKAAKLARTAKHKLDKLQRKNQKSERGKCMTADPSQSS